MADRSGSLHYRGTELDERFIPAVLEHLDEWTRKHSRATAEWAGRVGRELSLGDNDIQVLRLAALLHGMDRLGVPPEEYDICRVTDAEEALLRQSPVILGGLVPEEALGRVVNAVTTCREHLDGSGRPRGLKGEAIPLFARIVAVACSFLSLTMERPDYSPLTREAACERLSQHAGPCYDPRVVVALNSVVARVEGEAGAR